MFPFTKGSFVESKYMYKKQTNKQKELLGKE